MVIAAAVIIGLCIMTCMNMYFHVRRDAIAPANTPSTSSPIVVEMASPARSDIVITIQTDETVTIGKTSGEEFAIIVNPCYQAL